MNETYARELGEKLERLIVQFDEWMVEVQDPAKFEAFKAEELALGQILTRNQLICTHLMTIKRPALKVVSHG